MRLTLDVKDKQERDAIRTAMGDPQTRAFVVIVGNLLPLKPAARKRVLEFVQSKIEDDAQEQLLGEFAEVHSGSTR